MPAIATLKFRDGEPKNANSNPGLSAFQGFQHSSLSGREGGEGIEIRGEGRETLELETLLLCILSFHLLEYISPGREQLNHSLSNVLFFQAFTKHV